MTDGIYAAVVAAFLLVLLAAWLYADWCRRDRERRLTRLFVRDVMSVVDDSCPTTCHTCGLSESDVFGLGCQCWRDEPHPEWR